MLWGHTMRTVRQECCSTREPLCGKYVHGGTGDANMATVRQKFNPEGQKLHEPKRAGVRPETSVQNLPGNQTSGLTFVLQTGPERPGDLVEVAGRNQKTQTLVQKVDAKCVPCLENTDLETADETAEDQPLTHKVRTLVQKVDAKCVPCRENANIEDSRGDGPGSAIETQSANPRAESRRKVNTLQRKCTEMRAPRERTPSGPQNLEMRTLRPK